MKRLSVLFFLLVAVSALASSVLAASASAAKVPGYLVLPGESFPLLFLSLPLDEIKEGVEQNTIESELQGAAGTLKGKGVLLHMELTSDDEGTFEALFLLVTQAPATKCNTTNDAAGEVLLDGKFKAVWDITSTSGDGILFEPLEVVITCGAVKVKVKGTSLGLLKGEGTLLGTDFDHWLGSLLCKNASGGEPAEVLYWDLTGVDKNALLLSEFGTGFKKACELVKEEILLDSHKMAELMEVGT